VLTVIHEKNIPYEFVEVDLLKGDPFLLLLFWLVFGDCG